MKSRSTPLNARREDGATVLVHESSCGRLNLVLAAVEAERDNLSRAESLLGCLKIAMEYGSETDSLPYYPDVAQIAADMVRKSIQALDPINLPGPSRGKVREGILISNVAALALGEVPLLPLAILKTFPRKRARRLHRRNYSPRFSAIDVASSASA